MGTAGRQAAAAGDDAPKVYLAFWTLAAAPRQSVPFLRGRLAAAAGRDLAPIRRWIRELDDDFDVRERASAELARRLEAASGLLEKELAGEPSPEARSRIERLLGARVGAGRERDRVEKAVRVLEYAGSAEARTALEGLADGPGGAARRTRPVRR